MDDAAKNTDPRKCTCHPDDNPPVPCPRKYALTECRIAALIAAAEAFDADLSDYCDGPARDALRAAIAPLSAWR